MVLATDLKTHFEELAHFKARVLSEDAEPLAPDSVEDRRTVLKVALHCADLNVSAKPPWIASQWLPRIMRVRDRARGGGGRTEATRPSEAADPWRGGGRWHWATGIL